MSLRKHNTFMFMCTQVSSQALLLGQTSNQTLQCYSVVRSQPALRPQTRYPAVMTLTTILLFHQWKLISQNVLLDITQYLFAVRNSSGTYVWKLMDSWNKLLFNNICRNVSRQSVWLGQSGCGFDISLAGICIFVNFCMDLVVLNLLLWWTVK